MRGAAIASGKGVVKAKDNGQGNPASTRQARTLDSRQIHAGMTDREEGMVENLKTPPETVSKGGRTVMEKPGGGGKKAPTPVKSSATHGDQKQEKEGDA